MKLVPTVSVPHGEEAEAEWLADHATTATGEVLYTCPMESHAYIVTDEPGNCPECGMKLVPTSEVEHGPKSEALWYKEHGTTDTAEVLYTCPMHPEVHSLTPGQCPICEMALVPADEITTGTQGVASTTTQSAQVLYTCPMESHAYIVTDEPGKCPDCGMTLVPTSEVEHGPKSEALWREEHATTPTASNP
jgi:rubrerythrin